jgi:hypothetical protein
MPVCTKCEKNLPESSFRLVRSDGTKRQRRCAKCCDQGNMKTRRDRRAGITEDRRRTHCGELSHRAKLTEDDVRLIRQLDGLSDKKVGEKFDVGPTCIWYIRNGKTWTNVR